MNRYQLAWPPLTPGVKGLLILYATIFLFYPLLGGTLGTREFVISTLYLSNQGMFGELYLWQPVSYQLLHHDFFHLLFNCLVLYLFGAEVERKWNLKAFLAFTFGCGLGAAAFGIMWYGAARLISGQPGFDTTPIVGASGAISGLVAAYCLYHWNHELRLMFAFRMKGKWLLPIFVGVDLLRLGLGSNIAVAHHFGGMLTGLAIVMVVYKPLQTINRLKICRLKRKLRALQGNSRPRNAPDDEAAGRGGLNN